LEIGVRFRLNCLVALSVLSGPLAAQSQSLPLQHLNSNVFGLADGTFNAITLFNGSGGDKAELAIATGVGPVAVTVLSARNAQWTTESFVAVDSVLTAKALLPWSRPEGNALVLITGATAWGSGHMDAVVLEGWPLEATRRFALPDYIGGAALADVDADGKSELLVSTSTDTVAFDPSTGQTLWTLGVGGSNLLAAQLDADPALEIVIAGYPGRVFDGLTRLPEWTYVDGLGHGLASGQVHPGSPKQLISAGDTQLMVVQSDPWSPLWDMTFFDIDQVIAADLDGVGLDDLIVGEGGWGSVRVFDANTRAERYSVDNPGHGVAAVVVADLMGDAAPEVAFTPDILYGSGELIRLFDAATGDVRIDFEALPGATRSPVIGDVNGDGTREIFTASAVQPTRAQRFDALSRRRDWSSPALIGNANEPFYQTPQRVLLGEVDGDAARETIYAGTAISSGRIVVVDGVDSAVQLQIGDYSTNRPLDGRAIVGAELLDFDGNGLDDIVVLTRGESSPAVGSKLHVFSLQTGALLWESISMALGDVYGASVLVTRDAEGEPSEIVAVLSTGLRAFEIETGLLSWTFESPIGASSYAWFGAGSAEFVLADPFGQVTHYDAATRVPIRSYALPMPVYQLHYLRDSRRWSALVGDRFRLLAEDGSIVFSSESLGLTMAPYAIASAPSAFGEDIVVGARFGYHLYRFSGARVFSDSFEGY
jgi:outer membrane protein assembly factor BamB